MEDDNKIQIQTYKAEIEQLIKEKKEEQANSSKLQEEVKALQKSLKSELDKLNKEKARNPVSTW